ncbi:competence protein ComEC [Arthrobacter sp. OAP107]
MEGRTGPTPSRWQRYVQAAVDFPRADFAADDLGFGDSAATESVPSKPPSQPGPAHGLSQKIRADIRRRLLSSEQNTNVTETNRRRTDLRLAPAALLVWVATVAGPWLTPGSLLVVWGSLAASAGVLLATVLRRKKAGRRWRRSFLTTLTAALMLAAASTAHSAVSAAQRHDEQLAGLIAGRASVVAEAEVTASPRALKTPGPSGRAERWAAGAVARSLTSGGQVTHAHLPVVIIGGEEWQHAGRGQLLRVTGKLRPPDPGRVEAAILTASSPPVRLAAEQDWQRAPAALGKRFASASGWLADDARGLLPGMVTGDTSGLDEELETAMKTVGLTHLTAVSGANCSLILGALLLAARSLRLTRVPAAAVALTGLGLFVLMVGPDASVLRASLMGAIALASLAGGRAGRGLSFLCLAVIALLLVEPELGVSFGFLLSVLATLGIIVLGRCVMGWFPAGVPRWAAAAVAVPLSAQVLCGPVIVMLQPQFSTYSLLANVLVAPIVAPVTILGTAAVALLPLAPWLATVLIGVAGLFAGVVAAVARFTAGLPGAAPPWPEGVFGLLTMLLFSVVTLFAVWMAAHPARTVKLVFAAHAGVVRILDRLPEVRLRRAGPNDHGRLRVCNLNSGRKYQWPLPSNDRRRRQLTRRRGGT